MGYMLLNVRENIHRTPLLGVYLARCQSLRPFQDEYTYVAHAYSGAAVLPRKPTRACDAQVEFPGFYSRGIFDIWCRAMHSLAYVLPVQGSGSAVTLTGLCDYTELFELTIIRNFFGLSSTLVVPELVSVRGHYEFKAESPGFVPWDLRNIGVVMANQLKRYPELAQPFFGSKPANRAKCRKCGVVIESRTRHEFVSCRCGAIAVDGGYDYCRRVGNSADFAEMTDLDTVQYVKPKREDKHE